ncbi:MAG TPA: hypothetical protein VEC99_17800, partial [Clostridia bacterium]|nr:hypothetical protein [Clostridia bacterium]
YLEKFLWLFATGRIANIFYGSIAALAVLPVSLLANFPAFYLSSAAFVLVLIINPRRRLLRIRNARFRQLEGR